MNTITQSSVSTQYVQVQVTAIRDGSAYDPSGDPVSMAFVPITSPPSATDPTTMEWNTATWEIDPGPLYWAQVLVGPANGGVVLSIGSYVAWVRITDDPEVPALPGCFLSIT